MPSENSHRDLQTIRKLNRFLEEFDWLMTTYSGEEFKSALKWIANNSTRSQTSIHSIESYVPNNPNTHFLVGALPSILTDTTLFPSNEDIASFAKQTLSMKIPNWSKKSKYELIGQIVCNVNTLNDVALDDLVHVLGKIMRGDTKARKAIEKETKEKTNWNVIIQLLSERNK